MIGDTIETGLAIEYLRQFLAEVKKIEQMDISLVDSLQEKLTKNDVKINKSSTVVPRSKIDSNTMDSLQNYQRRLEQVFITLRTNNWSPGTVQILKKVTRFIGFFLLFLFILTPFIKPLLRYTFSKKPISKLALYGIITWLFVFFIFLIMKVSGKIPQEFFFKRGPPFLSCILSHISFWNYSFIGILIVLIFIPTIISIIPPKIMLRRLLTWVSFLFTIILNFFALFNSSFWSFTCFPFVLLGILTFNLIYNYFYRKLAYQETKGLRKTLRVISYIFFILHLAIIIFGIAYGNRTNFYGKFNINTTINKIEIGRSNFVILGLEISIAMFLLIVVLFYSIFPSLVLFFIILPSGDKKEISTHHPRNFLWMLVYHDLKKLIREFNKNHNWGWNRYYNYYWEGILSEFNIQIFLGFVGSIIMLAIPFLFSSAAYFAFSFLFSYRLELNPLLLVVGVIVFLFLAWFPSIFKLPSKIQVWYPLLFLIMSAIFFSQFLKDPSKSTIAAFLILSVTILLWVLAQVYDPGRRHWLIFLAGIGFLIFLWGFLKITDLKLIEIAPGFLSRLFGLSTSPLPHSELVIAISAIIPLFLLWVSPIINGFEVLDSKFSAHTLRILRWIIQRLKSHTILLGYGDLGKKVAEGVVKRVIISNNKKNGKFHFAEILSTRKQEFVSICTNFVVVDKNPGAFDESHPDLDYGMFGLSDIEIEGRKEPIVLLGLVGDCKEPGTLDDVNMEFSKNVIFTARDEEALFPLYNEIYKLHEQDPKSAPSAILSVERGVYGPYLEWRCLDKNIYFVYPAFLRGITLGEIISDDMIKQGMKRESLKETEEALEGSKILILGRGNMIFHILRCIHEDLIKFFYLEDPQKIIEAGIQANKFMERNIAIVTDEEYFGKISVKVTKQERDFKSKYLDYRYCFITSGILTSENIPRLPSAWRIPLYFNLPRDARIVEEILQIENPKIIIIASQSSLETATITQEVFHALERINFLREEENKMKPHIFVGSRMVEWYEVRDAVAWWRVEIDDKTYYPLQQVDSVVDFYDDAANMIISLYEALSEQPGNE